MEVQFIDSHVHLDITYRNHPERLTWLKEKGCLSISWAFAFKSENLSDLRHYLDLQRDTIHEIRKIGYGCYFLAGVHPRNIFEGLKPESIRELLIPSLEDESCLGIGEIGLETGTEHEKEVFLAQLDLIEEVAQRKKVMGIHTPRKNKAFFTAELLRLLEAYPDDREIMVVDHCRINTIQDVLAAGLWAGVTLSPVKTSFQDLEQVISNHRNDIERIMLNTDSGGSFHDDLFRFFHSEQFGPDIRKQLAKNSASSFFGLPE
jgi:predicted metal-dependent TIM-barrel fold hydrolase